MKFEHFKYTQDHSIKDNKNLDFNNRTPQSMKQRPGSASGSYMRTGTSSNKENNTVNDHEKRQPIDNLRGYYNKIRSSKNMRTRNSNYLNSVHNKHASSCSNLPNGSKISMKRWHTSINGSQDKSLLSREDKRPWYRNDAIPLTKESQKTMEENSIASRFSSHLKEKEAVK